MRHENPIDRQRINARNGSHRICNKCYQMMSKKAIKSNGCYAYCNGYRYKQSKVSKVITTIALLPLACIIGIGDAVNSGCGRSGGNWRSFSNNHTKPFGQS